MTDHDFLRIVDKEVLEAIFVHWHCVLVPMCVVLCVREREKKKGRKRENNVLR